MTRQLTIPFPIDNPVLIIDVNARFGKRLVSYFKRRDIYACYVTGVTIAKYLILAMNPAVVVLDLWSCENQVAKFLSFIRNSGCLTEVILMCGHVKKKTECKARRLSPAFYFRKPFNEDDLYAVVVRIMEMQSRRQMNLKVITYRGNRPSERAVCRI